MRAPRLEPAFLLPQLGVGKAISGLPDELLIFYYTNGYTGPTLIGNLPFDLGAEQTLGG